MTKTVNTPQFRASYPNVFKAKRNDLNGKDEYSIVALFPKGADLSALKAAAQSAIEEKWGTDKSKWPAKLKTPFRDQAEKAVDGKLPDGYEAGAIFLTLKSTQKPGVVDENVEPIIDPSQFYAGVWAIASVRAYAYDQMGNKGVSFGLGNIQKVKEGDPLGSRSRPTDDFAPISSGATASSSSNSNNATDIFS